MTSEVKTRSSLHRGSSDRMIGSTHGEAPPGAHIEDIAIHFDYPVVFTTRVFSPENTLLVEAISRKEPQRRHRAAVVVDGGVLAVSPALLEEIRTYATRHGARLELASEPIVLEGGEGAKASVASLIELAERFHELRMDRQSCVVVVGGGAILDLVGFAASIVHRGVRVIRVPTTVLAQADSGVGVKNGVNAFGKKNFLGTFAPPFAVLCDRTFLDHLPRRDVIAGMAEAVKVALIRDPSFFAWIEAHVSMLASGDHSTRDALVARSARLHLEHIATSGDPFELGSARPLDFGHWAAHKLESLTRYSLRHGEAVAIGVVLDAYYSVECGRLDRVELERIAGVLEDLGFVLWSDALDARAPDGMRRILEGLEEFREHLGGELSVTLLEAIGRSFEAGRIETSLVLGGVDWLRRRGGRGR